MLDNTSETTTRRRDTGNLPRPAAALRSGQQDVSEIADLLGDLGSSPSDIAPRPRRWRKRLVAGVAVAAVVAVGYAAITVLGPSLKSHPTSSSMTHTVKRADLLITVTEDGSLESAENCDIKCQVAGGTTIVWIIEDGKKVKKGTEILRLDSSKLAEDVSLQKIARGKAEAAAIQAEKDLAAAEIALEEYTKGTFEKDISEAASKVAIAQENLNGAENSLQHGKRMFRKGYITPQQLAAQETAVERAKLELGTAAMAKKVLEQYTRRKMTQELESKRDAARAKRKSEKDTLELEDAKLKRLTAQLDKCTVRAPKDGLVIYANEQMYYGDRDSEVKAGMKVHEEETVLRLPDLSRMRAKTSVHEAKVEQVRVGMRARIRIQDRDFQGSVESVANRPEHSWFLATVKKFPVKVQLDGESKDLRPGMTAEVEILVAHLKDVISLPVAALAEKDGQAFCCVKTGETLERRNVVLGKGNDKAVEVKQGLDVGEVVVLNPRAALGDRGDDSQKRPEIDVKSKFGANKPEQKGNAKGSAKGDSKKP